MEETHASHLRKPRDVLTFLASLLDCGFDLLFVANPTLILVLLVLLVALLLLVTLLLLALFLYRFRLLLFDLLLFHLGSFHHGWRLVVVVWEIVVSVHNVVVVVIGKHELHGLQPLVPFADGVISDLDRILTLAGIEVSLARHHLLRFRNNLAASHLEHDVKPRLDVCPGFLFFKHIGNMAKENEF